jgi:hypothetical protein
LKTVRSQCPLCQKKFDAEDVEDYTGLFWYHLYWEHLAAPSCWCGKYLTLKSGEQNIHKHMNDCGGVLVHYLEHHLGPAGS